MTVTVASTLGNDILRLDHTAIVVGDLDAAIDGWVGLTGAHVTRRERVDTQRVEIAMLDVGGTALELITPTDSESGVARFLTKRGESLHHVAFEVRDISTALERLEAAGFALIDLTPRPGAHGLVAFIHPRSTRGVLVELIQVTDAAAHS